MKLVPAFEGSTSTTALRRRVAIAASLLLVVPLLLVTRPGGSAVAVPLTAVPGGPVILDGNDPGDHVGATVTNYVRSVYTNLDANIAAGYVHNGKVAVIGPCKAVLTAIGGTGETFDQFATAPEVQAFFSAIGTNNYKIIHICDNDEGNVAVDLSTATENELALWGSAIATHVNRGGGLFSTGHGYAWLSDLFPGLVVTPGGTGASYVTTDGALFFPTLPANTLVNAINHFTFSSVPNPPLKTLLTESSGGVGRLVAIGGVTVRFPQIVLDGPASSDVGTNETYTLTAVTADGTVLSNNSFTYWITGVTGSVGTGTAVTDANGQYTFVLSGNTRGSTKIRVQLTLGGGVAAGTSTTTNWLSLPSAPTLTGAADVPGTSGASVQLTWTAPTTPGLTPVSDYVIQKSLDGTTWTPVADGTSTSTSYTVTGLDPNAIYDFRIAAVNADGPGPWSNILTNPIPAPQAITFPAPPSTVVSAGPVDLTATADSGLVVSYASNDPAVCTVSGAAVTLIAEGTCSITASRAATRSYTVASPVTRTFLVLPLPPLAAPAPTTTTGVGTATQTTTVPIPAGGSIALIDAAGNPVSLLVVPGQGTYALDVLTGTITFVPVLGFTGAATAVTFRVTDVYNQTATGTYVATVTAGVLATAATTSGIKGATQRTTIPVPAGGSVVLVNAAGLAVNVIRVAGQGTYTLNRATGIITFVPVATFVGQAPPATFRVTSAAGQSSASTYTATVTAASAARIVGSVRAPALTVANGPKTTVPVLCTLKSVRIYRCDVTLWATVSGRQVAVGHGTATVRSTVATRNVRVYITLTALGRALAAQPGGVPMRAAAAITPRGTTKRVHVSRQTRVVAMSVRIVRPVFFDSGKSSFKPSERRYLDGLRLRLAGVKSIDCMGYTDAMDTAGSNRTLGFARATKVCAYLVRGTRIVVRSVTLGEERPQATNVTPSGRALNRRTEMRLNY